MTLRRRSFDDDSALEAGVDHLLRGFDPLTEEPPAANPVAADIAPVPIADSYVVASRTFSRSDVVDNADFVTDNSRDQTGINAAFGSTLPQGVPGVAQGSITVVLAAGRYNADGLITIGSYGTLTGTGRGSNFNPSSTSLEFKMQTGSEIAHLTFIST